LKQQEFFTRKISVLKRDFSSGTGLFYSGTGLDVKDGFLLSNETQNSEQSQLNTKIIYKS
jgi:hypothetical protein